MAARVNAIFTKVPPPALLMALLLLLGLAVRLADLTDPPLDFNPTRQLRSAIIARGLYYQDAPHVDPQKRELALKFLRAQERLEPPILESLVAFTYRILDKERVWVARVYTTLFWMVGAIALYDLGRRMASPWAALIGVGYFLFLPFSIQASRSFQPDPGMTMLVLSTAWALDRWSEEPSWKWAVLAGVLGGLAALVKVAGGFFVGGMAFGVVVHHFLTERREGVPSLRLSRLVSLLRHPQVVLMALAMITPALLYYLGGIGEQSTGYLRHWTIVARWRELLQPSFYMRWMLRVDSILMIAVVLASFAGTLVASSRVRSLLWGFWGGYVAFCLTFPYHATTHDYYHLPLVGLVSLSLIPLAGLLIERVSQQPGVVRLALAGVVALFLAYNGWIGYSILRGKDFRQHPAYWQEVGEAIPPGAKAIGLTQDYGARLMYYGWRKIQLWPVDEGSDRFKERAVGAEYFVITAKNQLNDSLRDYLKSNFRVHARGEGYLIYDLKAKK